jgi:hypothetical protein
MRFPLNLGLIEKRTTTWCGTSLPLRPVGRAVVGVHITAGGPIFAGRFHIVDELEKV